MIKEYLKLIRKSKTAKSGIVTIVWGILILFGIVGPSAPPQTIDDFGKPQTDNTVMDLVGLGALGSGLMTLKGRADAEKKIKESET